MTGLENVTGDKGGQEISSSASTFGEAISELRPGCLELSLSGLENLQGWSHHSLSGNLRSCPALSPQGKGTPYLHLNLYFFSFILLLCTAVKSLSPIPQSLPGCIGPGIPASYRESTPALWEPQAGFLSWTHSSLSVPFLSWGPQTACSIIHMP